MPSKMRSQSASFAAPVGGWNARDPEADMQATDALVLDNVIPRNRYVELRPGFLNHTQFDPGAGPAGGGSVSFKTLIEYSKADGTRKLIGCVSSFIFDLTTEDSPTALSGTTPTSDKWQHVTMNGVLILVNGSDVPQQYNGTTRSDLTITGSGLTSAFLVHVTNYKGRAYYVEKDTASIWYAAAGAHSGATTELDLSSVFRDGGYIQLCVTWSRDDGSGMQEFLVVISNTGEMLIYGGDDPGASNWTIVNRFYISEPLGRRAAYPLGSDIILLTQEGVIPISSVVAAAGAEINYVKLTDKIDNAFNELTRDKVDTFGWQCVNYAKEQLLVINAPIIEDKESVQLVMNTKTGAWCRFTNLNPSALVVFDGDLYFSGTSSDPNVYKYGNTRSDNGTRAIPFEIKTAYNYYGNMANKKHFKLVRAHVRSNNTAVLTFGVDVDFEGKTITQTITPTYATTAEWDIAMWDTAEWAISGTVQSEWRNVTGLGRAAAIIIKAEAAGAEFSISSFDMIYEEGSYL